MAGAPERLRQGRLRPAAPAENKPDCERKRRAGEDDSEREPCEGQVSGLHCRRLTALTACDISGWRGRRR